jgi:D-alanyl-D-alanine carboxypeptidase/D-alanyl-D-alanine-endopeptidase (penicillin-binding protein 4)
MRGGVRPAAFACAVVAALPLAATSPAAGADRRGALPRGLDAIVDAPRFAHAWWGVEVRSLRSGAVVYARNPERNLKPASTLKLVTTAAVLDAFGPDARIRTTLETAGRLDGLGRILGDVYLVGRGDPNLSGRFADGRPTAIFDDMAEALRQQGVRRIEGASSATKGSSRATVAATTGRGATSCGATGRRSPPSRSTTTPP